MSSLVSFSALFVSILLVQFGSGSIGPLDALAASARGFSLAEIGMLGSGHFLGFFIGCYWVPRLMKRIGYSRAFAAVTAIGVISVLLHTLWIGPWQWTVLRVVSGVSIAGAYTVLESWINQKVTNQERGGVLGFFRLIDLVGNLGAQLLISVLDPTSYVAFNVIAILVCLSLFPLTMTTHASPELTRIPRINVIKIFRLSPLGFLGVVVAGVSSASFRMVGPVYGEQTGLMPAQIALFLAAAVLGGAISQVPVGWLSDRVDRRRVLIVLSLLSLPVCYGLSRLPADAGTTVYWLSGLFGLVVFPIYSVSAAHANDFGADGNAVEINASLLAAYTLGAIVSPLTAGQVMQVLGTGALFGYIACAHVLLVLIGLLRMRARPSAERKMPFEPLPKTSWFVSKFMRR
ncbi:MAG: MFS transporter [Gammaproteobacteria bacterium]|nr:MFS transporter [Gammaproteobacteria bacterium]